MASRKKKRRSLTLNKRRFIWWVSDDKDAADIVLRVYSEDKKFIVSYHFGQPDSQRFLIVLGREFPGLVHAGSVWIRLRCPKWESDSRITPATVRQLIKWCLFEDRPLIRLNWKGEVIEDDNPIAPETVEE
jgi:hypothetical protein